MHRILKTLGLIVILAAFASTALAQGTNATITGTVNDEAGNIFPGATVTATNTATGFTHTASAGPDGRSS